MRFERLGLEHVEGSGRRAPGAQPSDQGIGVQQAAAGGVDQDGARLHPCKLGRTECPSGGGRQRQVQAYHVGVREQLIERDGGAPGTSTSRRVV